MGGNKKKDKHRHHDDTHYATTSEATRRIVTQAKRNNNNATALAMAAFMFVDVDVQSAGGAFCSGLARSDGYRVCKDSAKAAVLKKLDPSSSSPKQQQEQRTTGEWIYSGDDNHRAHAAEPSSLVGAPTASCGITSSSTKEDSQQHQQEEQPLRSSRNLFFQRTRTLFFSRWWNKAKKSKNKDNKPFQYQLQEESEFFQCQMPLQGGVFNFSSNHVLVNKARTKRGIAALVRDSQMDDLARDIAYTLMKNTLMMMERKSSQTKKYEDNEHVVLTSGFDILQTCDLQNLVMPKLGRPFRRLGYNFALGKNVRAIHTHMMINDISCKNNMLDSRFEYFGMGTATHHGCSSSNNHKNNDTELYMVQLYVS